MLIGRGGGLERLDRSRSHNILSPEDVANGKTTSWPELEITGTIKNLSPALWKLQHLTALYLNDNSLFRLPSSISLLHNLRRLDLSNNKLRSLPAEIGDLCSLRELMLNNNYLRALPYELGKLFQLTQLGLKVCFRILMVFGLQCQDNIFILGQSTWFRCPAAVLRGERDAEAAGLHA